MLVERGVVKIGVEIEIPQWRDRRYVDVVGDLLDQGYMLGDIDNWEEIHTYRCSCELGCQIVRSGDVIVPPLVSATYDASLPVHGAEFVVSPVVMIDGLTPIRQIWDTVTKGAVWTDELPDRRGDNLCSPSIHIHCSVTTPGTNTRITDMQQTTLANDILHALYLFAPELLLLADVTDVRRGLRFRQLLRMADQGGHHGFVHVRAAREGFLHVEWRLFEATYTSFDYVEAVAYLSGVLTRALNDPAQRNRLMAAGLTNAFNDMELTNAVYAEDVDEVLGMVSPQRYETLRNTVMSLIDDDRRGQEALAWLFKQAEGALAPA